MDEEVHGFAADNVQPYPYDRSPVNPGYNGNMNVYPEQKYPKKKSLHQKHHSHKDIAERKMEEEVHGFSANNVPGTAFDRSPVDPGQNGNKNVYPAPKPTKKKSLHQKQHKKDWVAERNMDPYVYDFVAPEVAALNHRENNPEWSVYDRESAPEVNGQSNLYPSSLHQHKHKHHAKDIAERAMDEEVHGFASDNVRGIAWGRQEDFPYGNNGNLNIYSQHKAKKHHKWVAERNMDPYVYDFVAPEVDLFNHRVTDPKWSVYDRSSEEPLYNGQSNLYPEPVAEAEPKKAGKKAPAPTAPTKELEGEGEAAAGAFMQHSHKHRAKDIAERAMDEEVHDFAEDNTRGIMGIRQEAMPYGDNGNLNMYAQHKHKHHKHAKDIAERAMDEEVHGFASDNVRGIPWGR